ncbi:(2Fe-2S) ferredoxin domain-containing protein [Anaerosporobacter faecicola]|uniref:(2Fe-2S) ferredoxin domain-containing protein n=1 Tax=Anaerosporobacter faecicola TaxID=2718714 RepID=UPI00143AE4F6|nr:(2Fe-2S) ferredoxin domain-containing protein [Anaerosporobacter faecicola]
MLISVCIGSACHLKGSYDVIDKLQELVEDNNLGNKVELKAVFCLGNCQNGVSVKINEEEHIYSVTKKTVNTFFEEVVKPKLTE